MIRPGLPLEFLVPTTGENRLTPVFKGVEDMTKKMKMAGCVVLIAALGAGSTGCGTFEVFTLASAAGKLANNQAGTLTAAEWQLLSSTAANLAGEPELALTAAEAQAIVAFMSTNGYVSFDDLGSNPPSAESLQALAQAFSGRVEGGQHNLTDPEDVKRFFERYLRELGQGLRNMLAGMGVQIPA